MLRVLLMTNLEAAEIRIIELEHLLAVSEASVRLHEASTELKSAEEAVETWQQHESRASSNLTAARAALNQFRAGSQDKASPR